MGNQDGQHLVLCEIPAGDAVHVHRQEPVPLPLRAVREAEFPAAHGKRPVMAVDSVMARPLDKAFFGDQHVLLKHRQRGLIPHGEIHSLAFERKPGFPPGVKPSGKQADIRIAFALQFFSGNGTIQRASRSVYQERRGHIRHQSPHLLLKSRFEDADAG